jgi:ankyrin repeat protein
LITLLLDIDNTLIRYKMDFNDWLDDELDNYQAWLDDQYPADDDELANHHAWINDQYMSDDDEQEQHHLYPPGDDVYNPSDDEEYYPSDDDDVYDDDEKYYPVLNDNYNYTEILIESIQNGNIKMIDYMPVDIAPIIHQDIDIMHMAIKTGNVDITLRLLKPFLESGGNINIANSYGDTFLHIAVGFCYRKIVQELVKAGADVNARNDIGKTPLHVACHYSNWAVVRYLLAHGSDMSAVDNSGRSCLHHVVFPHSYTCQTARKLLFRGIDVNQKDINGLTPLHKAIKRGYSLENMIRLFLKYGANINEQDNEGRTPFHHYMIHINKVHSTANIRVLLENGADLTLTDNKGDSCMSIAMFQSHNVLQEILSYLRIRDESYYALVACTYLQELRVLHMLDCDSIALFSEFTGPLVKGQIQPDDW